MKAKGKLKVNFDNRKCSIVSCIIINDQNVIVILYKNMIDFFDSITL